MTTPQISAAQSLPRSFYERDTLLVAKDLLGCRIVREYQGKILTGRIVETEAYIGRCDKACHAYNYKYTPRTKTLFGQPGTAYLYLIYGMYTCLNFVTETDGEPAAVLIRALEADSDPNTMAYLRFDHDYANLTPYERQNFLNGPGKLCQALALDTSFDGHDLRQPPLYVLPRKAPISHINQGPRIGIDYAEEAKDFPWRFWLS